MNMKKKIETHKESQARSPKKPVKVEGTNIRPEGTRNTTAMASEDVVQLILRDHKPLKTLIQTLKDPEMERVEKEGPFEEFVPLLLAHARAEEQSLYVQMKEEKDLRMEAFEGDTEHALAEQLVHEINATPDDDEWNAKVKVLAEMLEHHIQEEEDEMLEEIEEKMDLSTRQAVGGLYTQIKTELDVLNRPRPARPQASNREMRLN
jgi:hemerythrin superfamily protein